MNSMSKLAIGGAVVVAFVLGMTARSLTDRSRAEDDRVEINRLRFEVVQWQCRWMTLAVERPDGEQTVREFMDGQTEIVVQPPTKKSLQILSEHKPGAKK